jgi:subtilisin family serine protease
MNRSTFLPGKRAWKLLTLTLVFIHFNVNGQDAFNYFCRVYFRDKGANTELSYSSSDLLSIRAIDRRSKAGITAPDYRDLPVFKGYIDQIKELGFTFHCTSKWMNTALFKTKSMPDTALLKSLPFVSDAKIVKKPIGKSRYYNKLDLFSDAEDLPPFDRPLTMMHGDILHSSGYDGTGVLIAILDAGFTNADIVSSLSNLRNRNGIKYTWDFVNNDQSVYNYHYHGTAILSVLAGVSEGNIQGTAPGADFILLRTEDASTEFSVEEDFWTAAAEFADSAGADIISSSLGYFNFDEPSLNYKFSDLDGNTAFVTRAADVAASKGILVVCSAGNERNNAWKHILVPSDGDSVLSIGAVDGNGMISSFSSAGPSSDGRVKPDNTAMGVSVIAQTELSSFVRMNGTSLSCPVLSGMAASLKQAAPNATNIEIINALHRAGDRFSVPDTLYGYGTPDMIKALDYLQELHLKLPEKGTLTWPNPTTGDFEVNFRDSPGSLVIEIYSSSGSLIFRKEFPDYAGRNIALKVLSGKPQGIYLIKLKTGKGTFVNKIIKLNDLR